MFLLALFNDELARKNKKNFPAKTGLYK